MKHLLAVFNHNHRQIEFDQHHTIITRERNPINDVPAWFMFCNTRRQHSHVSYADARYAIKDALAHKRATSAQHSI